MTKPQMTDYKACRNRTRKISAGKGTYSLDHLRPLMVPSKISFRSSLCKIALRSFPEMR